MIRKDKDEIVCKECYADMAGHHEGSLAHVK